MLEPDFESKSSLDFVRKEVDAVIQALKKRVTPLHSTADMADSLWASPWMAEFAYSGTLDLRGRSRLSWTQTNICAAAERDIML